MTSAYDQLQNGVADLSQDESKSRGRNRDWCLFGAIVGLFGGLVAALVGSLLTAVAWFTATGSSYAQPLGTTLLIMTIPLLVFGAHCLDSMDRRKDRRRETRFHQGE